MYCVVKTDITPTGAPSAGAETAPPDTTPNGAITIDTTLVPHPPVPHPPVPLPQLPYTDSNGICKIYLEQQNEQSIKTSVAYYAIDLQPRVLLAEKRRNADLLLCNNRLHSKPTEVLGSKELTRASNSEYRHTYHFLVNLRELK